MRILPILILLFFGTNTFSQSSLTLQGENQSYQQALQLLNHKNLVAAKSEFIQYLEKFPDGARVPEATYYRAYCAVLLYHKEGEKLITQFVRRYPEHPKAVTAYFEMGNFFYKSRNYTKATQYYKQADFSLLSAEEREVGVFRAGYSFFRQKKFTDALPYFNQLKTGNGNYSSASSYYAGYIEFENEQYSTAVADFERTEKNSAYQSEIPYMKASALFRMQEYDQLINYTKNKIDKGDRYNNGQILFLLTAESYFLRKDFEQAEKYYSEYTDLIRGRIDPDVRYRIAYSQYAMDKSEEAIQNFKEIAGAGSELEVFASYYLGILYQKTGNLRYALTAFDQVRNNKFNSELKENAEYQYGKLSLETGDTGQAIRSMEGFLEKFPNSNRQEEINELLSEAYLNTNDYARAIKHIESLKTRSTPVKQAYQKANYLQGTVYFNKGDYRRSVDLFQVSIDNSVDQEYLIQALFWQGEAYSIGKRYDEAQKSYLKILGSAQNTSSPYVKRTRYGLGYTYYNNQQYDEAREQFDKFLKSDPPVSARVKSDAYVRLADCYYVIKSYEPALANYRNALQLKVADMDYIYLQMGMISGLQEDYIAADGFFDRVVNQGVTSRYYDNALFQKAQLKFNRTEYRESIQLYTTLIKKKPSSNYVPYALMRRASAFYNTNQSDVAVKDYEELLNSHITHPITKEALIPLQGILSDLGRSDQYDQYLARYKEANPDEKGMEEIEFESYKTRYFSQKYTEAISGLKAFVSNYPQDARLEEATYYIGDSYYRLNQYDSSLIWLGKLETATSFWQYPRVMERMAELSMVKGRYEEAAGYYRKVESLTANKRQQNQARSGLMTAYYHEGKYDSAVFYATKILNSGPTDVNAENEATLYLGKCYFAMGRYEEAEDEFLNTTNSAKDAYGAEAQYMLGDLFYQKEEFRQSIEFLIDLNEKYPAYQDWVGKGFLLIANNYVAMEDYFQAKGTLNSLIEYFPDESIKSQARSKLLDIEKMEEEKVKDLEKMSTDSISVDSLNREGGQQ